MALEWIWYFIWYSFLGFLLEVGYARWTGGRRDRKCLLLLPLCPVYGLGACAVLLLPPWVLERPLLLVVAGGAAATGVEYGMALFYERVLRVSFWNYDGLTGSIHGRVCLPFALAWSLLILPLVYLVHPAVARLADGIPAPGVLGGPGRPDWGSGHFRLDSPANWGPGLPAMVSPPVELPLFGQGAARKRAGFFCKSAKM